MKKKLIVLALVCVNFVGLSVVNTANADTSEGTFTKVGSAPKDMFSSNIGGWGSGGGRLGNVNRKVDSSPGEGESSQSNAAAEKRKCEMLVNRVVSDCKRAYSTLVVVGGAMCLKIPSDTVKVVCGGVTTTLWTVLR
jgi:hypothetical protein